MRLACAALGVALAGCAYVSPPRLWDLPPPPPRDAAVVDPARLHRSTLPNGLEILIYQDERFPAFDAGLVTRRGAGVELPEQAGLAVFTAELMGRGAGGRDALELAGVVDALGADLSVSAGWDSLSATVGGLSIDQDVLLDILADVVLRPDFREEEALRIRAEQLAKIARTADDAAQLAARGLFRTLYPGHRFGVPLDGSAETVAKLDAAGARAFHARMAGPSDAIVWATGDVDPEALLAGVRERFGDWPAATLPDLQPAPLAPPARRVVVIDRPELGQAQIAVGHEGIARTDPRRLEVQLLNTVLGAGGFSSRLMGRIRGVEGLTYGISSHFAQRHQPGPFAVLTFTRVPEVERLLAILFEELERIRSEPPGPDELAAAQSLRTGRFALALEDSAAVTQGLVDLDVYGLPRDSLDTYRGRVRALQPAEIANVAQALIHPERVSIVVVGPAAELMPQLEAYGPVEVVTPD
jgi:zinc protease